MSVNSKRDPKAGPGRGIFVLYGFAVAGALALLLSARWGWVRLVFAVPVSLFGLGLLIGGRSVLGRLKSGSVSAAGARLTGVGLLAFGVGFAAALTFPYQPLTVALAVVCAAVVVGCVLAMRRNPELWVFWNASAGPPP